MGGMAARAARRAVHLQVSHLSLFPSRAPRALRAGMRRPLGHVLLGAAGGGAERGGSLGLLRPAPTPPGLAWAAGDPVISEAFARAGAAIEEAGRRLVPEPVRDLVRDLVRERVDGWDGRPLGLSTSWVEDAVARLPADARPPARLALLTALASYQVSFAVVEDARRHLPGDAALVGLTAWASLTAARLTGPRGAGGGAPPHGGFRGAARPGESEGAVS